MKKLLSSLVLAILGLIFGLSSCEKAPEEIPVSSVSLNQPTAEMVIGETVQLSATVLPSNATEKTLSWASSKQSVATVSNNGLVTAMAEGTSTITVSAGDKSASCSVTVEKKVIPVTSVSLNKTELTLVEGGEETLVATVKPDDATDKTVTWKSSDEAVVTVKDGKVTAKKEGTATVTASAGDKSASCAVTVEKKVVPVTSVSLNKTELTLVEGGEETLVATVKPDDATDKTVTWKSSDETVVTVKDGKVTAKKAGTVTVTASAGDKSASCEVTVKKASQGNNIAFADSGIKAKLVAAFDTNNDGEISYEEAAAVTSLDGVFSAIKTYKSFDEFQYFTSVIEIPDKFFKDWGQLSSIILPEGLSYIGSFAFMNCVSLVAVSIPKVSYIGNGAFNGCSSLKSIIIPDSISGVFGQYLSEDDWSWKRDYYKDYGIFRNCTSLESVVLPSTISTIGYQMFSGCSSLKTIIIPDSVTCICPEAFRLCTNLSTVNIPKTVNEIGHWAFSKCESIKSIVIPNGVPFLINVFQDCKALESVVLPNSLINISGAFIGTNLSTVNLPNSIRVIDSAFNKCNNLITITIPDSVESMSGTFEGCISLTSVTIPESVTNLWGCFRDCPNLTSIIIPESVADIGSAFERCSNLVSVTIPESISTLDRTFVNCTSLSTVVIPNSVQTISAAFQGCTSLDSIVIPSSVKTIKESAFYGCSSMSYIRIESAEPPKLLFQQYTNRRYPFDGTSCPIYVPSSSVDTYKTTDGWSTYADRIQAIPE